MEQSADSQGRTESIIQGLADSFFSLDRDWRFVLVNLAAQRAPFARPAAELRGRVIWELYPVLAGSAFHRFCLDAAQDGEPRRREAQCPLDGRWYNVCARGHAGGLDVFMRDVNEGKRAEAELRQAAQQEAAARVRALMEACLDPLFIIEPDSVVTDANEAAVRATGAARGRILGGDFADFFTRPETVREACRRAFAQGAIADCPLAVKRCGGGFMDVLCNFSVYRDAGGKVLGLLAAARDVTAQRQAEAALSQQIREKATLSEELRQTQKLEAVGLLAGGIAHDFNNLVAAIAGNNYFLLEDLPKGSPMRVYSEEIGRSTDLAASLTRQLLAISRKQVLQPRVLDINSVLISMSKMLMRLMGHHIKIEMKPHASLWPVKIDSGQLEQIIMNLAINARDAMPKGGVLALSTANRILKRGREGEPADAPEPGCYVCLEVRDTGVGMEETTRRHIFEPFFTTKEAGRGTGLGLAVVHRIVKQCRGGITVESRPGRGSAFRILFPSEKRGAEVLLPGDAAKSGHAGHGAILVVEDNEAFSRIVKLALSKHGYNVSSSSDAEEALAYCLKAKGPIDLVLTDIVLPGMDGIELAKRLKEQRPGLRVIYMSGYAGEATAKVRGAGEAVVLEKPFSPDKLLGNVRRVLEKSQGEMF
ncbi:MAG: response regulator [Elusimicrobia bacterium]|nr:response regulator [Elusimicrobiota bacterium]